MKTIDPLKIVTPDVAASLSFTYALAITGKSEEIRQDAEKEVAGFFRLIDRYDEQSPQWMFLSRIKGAVITSGGFIATASNECDEEIERAKEDFQRKVMDGVLINKIKASGLILIGKLLFIMGFGYVMTKLGLGATEIAPDKQEDLEWLPLAVAFAGPVVLNLIKDLWKAITLSGYAYRRDIAIYQSRVKKYQEQISSIEYVLELSKEALIDLYPDWDGTHTTPTLRMLRAHKEEEENIEVSPPLLTLLTDSTKSKVRQFIEKTDVSKWKRREKRSNLTLQD